MSKKRKIESNEAAQKSTPVEVIVEDVTSHPLCLHGPTLLFSSEKGRYFACASCRNKKDCTVHIDEEDWQKEGVKKRNEKYFKLIPKIDKAAAWSNLNEVRFLFTFEFLSYNWAKIKVCVGSNTFNPKVRVFLCVYSLFDKNWSSRQLFMRLFPSQARLRYLICLILDKISSLHRPRVLQHLRRTLPPLPVPKAPQRSPSDHRADR